MIKLKRHQKHIVSVAGIITNDDNDILMIKHPRRGWEIPGGIIDEGEDLLVALKREVIEETGISIYADKIVGLFSNLDHTDGYNGYETIPPIMNIVIKGRYSHGDFVLSEESEEIEWVKQQNVLTKVTSEMMYDRLEAYFTNQDSVSYQAYHKKPYKRVVRESM